MGRKAGWLAYSLTYWRPTVTIFYNAKCRHLISLTKGLGVEEELYRALPCLLPALTTTLRINTFTVSSSQYTYCTYLKKMFDTYKTQCGIGRLSSEITKHLPEKRKYFKVKNHCIMTKAYCFIRQHILSV